MGRIAALATLTMATSFAFAAPSEPGGSGVIKSSAMGECFHVRDSTLVQVCAEYTINWKLFVLMGEPIGNYVLSWKLVSVKLMDPTRYKPVYYAAANLPADLQKAAGSLELYVDAVAAMHAVGVSSQARLHHFDTGTSVRAGDGKSFNTPGSPNWGELFGLRGDACEPKGTSFLAASEAKKEFRAGVQLDRIATFCPRSGLSNVSDVQRAIVKLCEPEGADKVYLFCPAQKERKKDKPTDVDADTSAGAAALDGRSAGALKSSAHELLDEGAERPIIQKRLEREIAGYRPTASAACSVVMSNIDVCYAKAQCVQASPPTGLSAEDCDRAGRGEPSPPVRFRLTRTYSTPGPHACDADCEEESRSIREAEAAEDKEYEESIARWNSRLKNSVGVCQAYVSQVAAAKSCEARHRSACNPQSITTREECIGIQTRTKGPTENDARKLVQKDWQLRAKTGTPITNSILDDSN